MVSDLNRLSRTEHLKRQYFKYLMWLQVNHVYTITVMELSTSYNCIFQNSYREGNPSKCRSGPINLMRTKSLW